MAKTLVLPPVHAPKDVEINFEDDYCLIDACARFGWFCADIVRNHDLPIAIGVSDTGAMDGEPYNVLASLMFGTSIYGSAVFFKLTLDDNGEEELQPLPVKEFVALLEKELDNA